MTTCGISPTYSKTLRLIALPPYDDEASAPQARECEQHIRILALGLNAAEAGEFVDADAMRPQEGL